MTANKSIMKRAIWEGQGAVNARVDKRKKLPFLENVACNYASIYEAGIF